MMKGNSKNQFLGANVNAFKLFVLALLLISTFDTFSQGQPQLHLDFEGCLAEDVSDSMRTVVTNGNPSCVCSSGGDGFRFDGLNDFLVVDDSTMDFNLAFTLSFWMKPEGVGTNQQIIDWSPVCGNPKGVSIAYDGVNKLIFIDIRESISNRIFFSAKLDSNICWHGVTLERSGSLARLFMNGRLIKEESVNTVLDLDDLRILTIGSGPCVPQNGSAFEGALDEVKVFNGLLPRQEIIDNVPRTPRILTSDTLIFLGNDVIPVVDEQCVQNMLWSPALEIINATTANPTISPTENRVYNVRFSEDGCVSDDRLRITVVDSSQVSCNDLVLPTAFTPNGDMLNEVFFISNGYIIDELNLFEIFDRWGGRVFSTKDANDSWDGRYQDELVMPGVYVYKIEYSCDGNSQIQTGSFTVLN